MNTIEERAIDAAQDFAYTELDAGTIIEEHTHGEYNAYKQGFYEGANEQHKIDIDKARAWLRDTFPKKRGQWTCEEFVNNYLKAMED